MRVLLRALVVARGTMSASPSHCLASAHVVGASLLGNQGSQTYEVLCTVIVFCLSGDVPWGYVESLSMGCGRVPQGLAPWPYPACRQARLFSDGLAKFAQVQPMRVREAPEHWPKLSLAGD